MTTRPRFLVCGWSDAEVGLVRPVLEAAACGLDMTFRADGYAGPAFDPTTHTGLIILGDSQKHSDDVECYGREMEWVRAARAHDKPTLGICHGALLLAHLEGGKLGYGRKLTDKGLSPVELTPAGKDDPVLQHAAGVAVAQWHYDTFTVPEGAVELARSTNEECPHSEAFRIGEKVYGVQFHPEPTAEMIFQQRWYRQRPADEEAASAEAAGRKTLEAWVAIAKRG